MPKPDEQVKDPVQDPEKDDSFTNLNPDELAPELKAVYKSMQADYTRKTQTLAERRKEIDDSLNTWQKETAPKFEKLGALEKEVEQWRAWHAAQQKDVHAEEPDLPGTQDDPSAKKIQELEEKLQALTSQTTRTSEEVGRMLRYQDELNELKTTDPELNKDEVIDFMLKEGITDPKRAYKELYQDKIINREAEARFVKMKAEFLEKQKADMLTGPGSPVGSSIFWKPPTDGKPSSWDKTLDEVLISHRKSELGIK